MFIRRASAILVVAFTLAGCGGASDRSASDHATTSARRSTTTVAPTTTTTVPPPYSFDNSVPPPKLINTGTDYASIFSSLNGYASWLKAHGPDTELVPKAFVVGTPVYARLLADLRILQKRNLRFVEVRRQSEIAVVGRSARAVSLQVHEHLERELLVRSDGTTQDEQAFASPLLWNVLLQADGAGRWRIASVEPAEASSLQVNG
jgi:hypothetical protein